jgi:hypothetical protein
MCRCVCGTTGALGVLDADVADVAVFTVAFVVVVVYANASQLNRPVLVLVLVRVPIIDRISVISAIIHQYLYLYRYWYGYGSNMILIVA